MIQRYVLGFMFSEDLEYVLLVNKKKPAWQCGLLNGIGGKIEEEESEFDAIRREVFEEAGLKTYNSDWKYFAYLHSKSPVEGIISMMCSRSDKYMARYFSKTNERIGVYNTKLFRNLRIIPNLNWLIPMAKNALNGKERSKRINIFESL